ncbi:Calmodulin-like protein 7 [Heracleum sosnowskyi]|uniref:Calmodulin-like protein 7 n=1 Tax=Heracleum sosnowskyi TaxID=360622 RepID=A0AAD8IF15_9APIA|nr:Calmodulin-like protein 7 [Heracleum sosnowskyi]
MNEEKQIVSLSSEHDFDLNSSFYFNQCCGWCDQRGKPLHAMMRRQTMLSCRLTIREMAFTCCIQLEPNREMTIEEFRAWLRRYDMDHDGKISREELGEALRSLRIWFGWWKAREGIKAADTDGNGYINNSEEIEKLVKYAQKNLHMKIKKNSW